MAGGKRSLPTTVAGAEYGVVLAFVTLRAFDVAQLVLAVPGSLADSPRPLLDGSLIAIFCAWSGVLCTVLLRRRRFESATLVWLDVALGVVILLATPVFTIPADRFSSWAAWGYAVTLSVAAGAGAGLRPWWQTTGAVTLLAGCYLVAVLPGAVTTSQTATTFTNALAYPMFAIVMRLPVNYMRRLAADADASRSEVGRLAQAAERDRHRLLLHDQASVLSLLAEPEPDPVRADAARAQAASGALRVRQFLADEQEPVTPFAAALRGVAAEFPDLSITLNLDGVQGDPLDETVNEVRDAVRTLLHNVRNHARASGVVLYAETRPGRWEVQVSDDGAGFDPNVVPERFGLGQQVRARMEHVGASVEVVSAPGEGTIVRMVGEMP